MSTGFEDIPEEETQKSTGNNEIIRAGHRYILDTSNNDSEMYLLARIVFQQWLSTNAGIKPGNIPIELYINGKCYIREDCYQPEAELDWFRQMKARGEA